MTTKIIHLLIPKQFRVWCTPNREINQKAFTMLPSECTCANCLTRYRNITTGRHNSFRVSHTGRNPREGNDWSDNPVLPENL